MCPDMDTSEIRSRYKQSKQRHSEQAREGEKEQWRKKDVLFCRK